MVLFSVFHVIIKKVFQEQNDHKLRKPVSVARIVFLKEEFSVRTFFLPHRQISHCFSTESVSNFIIVDSFLGGLFLRLITLKCADVQQVSENV